MDGFIWFVIGLAVSSCIYSFAWIRWNEKCRTLTKEQAIEVWEIVAGRSACGDPRAETIARKWHDAFEQVYNEIGEKYVIGK